MVDSNEWRLHLFQTLHNDNDLMKERINLIRLDQDWVQIDETEVYALTNQRYPIYQSSMTNSIHVCDYGCSFYLNRENDNVKICCISFRKVEDSFFKQDINNLKKRGGVTLMQQNNKRKC